MKIRLNSSIRFSKFRLIKKEIEEEVLLSIVCLITVLFSINVCTSCNFTWRFINFLQHELALKRGFLLESHRVVTEDGYLLTLHRIPYGRSGPAEHISEFALLIEKKYYSLKLSSCTHPFECSEPEACSTADARGNGNLLLVAPQRAW